MNEQATAKPLFLNDDDGKPLLLDPVTERHMPTKDLRDAFARMSLDAPRDPEFEQAFLLSKIRMLESHPSFNAAQRTAMAEKLRAIVKPSAKQEETPPPPGGVGYGVFYNDSFRSAFNDGTALAVDIIAPTQPGGNVSTSLYLTSTNRSAKGAEAFVAYNGQNEARFLVFDWARDDHWQTNIGFSQLGEYLTHKTAHGTTYQVLSIINQTYLWSDSTWANYVYLINYVNGGWDCVYSYKYTSSEEEQKQGWIGSWGPIVETFQDSYHNTNELGFLGTNLQSRDTNMQWSDWAPLLPSDSYIRNDNHGFQLVFLDPNYSYAVH